VSLLTFEEARARVLESAVPVGSERVPLDGAVGRVLRERVLASNPVPPFSYSAMDGFALRAPAEAGPLELAVSGESRTGHPPGALVPNTAFRISTGAIIPEDADAVVPIEIVEVLSERIRITRAVRPGDNVRQAGEDLARGAVALEAGCRLSPAALGLLAQLDRASIEVARRPRVAILCTGDELRPPGTPPSPGKIPDSISLPLTLLAAQAGADARFAGYLPDEREPTERAVRNALGEVDLLLTVGGVSVGEHDWVRPALESEGIRIDFFKVAIKPGKPITFGRRGSEGPTVLALPGNPASALITFALFGMPLLRAMQCDSAPLPTPFTLPLLDSVRHKPGRLEFLRARIEGTEGGRGIRPLENQASGALTALAWSDTLALFPSEVAELQKGSLVQVLRWADF
jgi:molybdopterin molybdotransferase